MKSITRIGLGLGAAALVASGGSAFTNSNNMTAVAADHVGYGSAAVSGVTVSNIAYNVSSTDSSQLHDIVFTADENVSGTGYQALLTINGSTNTPITCARAWTTSTAITCLTPGQTIGGASGVVSVQLTVTPV